MKRSGLLKRIAAAAALPMLGPIAKVVPEVEEAAITTEPFWIRFSNGALLRTDLTSMSRLRDCVEKCGGSVSNLDDILRRLRKCIGP
jgi:hypothetical protein